MQPDKNENQLIVWMPFVWPSGVVFANLAKACHIFKKNIFFNRTQSFLGTNAKDCPLHCIRLSIFGKIVHIRSKRIVYLSFNS